MKRSFIGNADEFSLHYLPAVRGAEIGLKDNVNGRTASEFAAARGHGRVVGLIADASKKRDTVGCISACGFLLALGLLLVSIWWRPLGDLRLLWKVLLSLGAAGAAGVLSAFLGRIVSAIVR
jgi:hypothetical protein